MNTPNSISFDISEEDIEAFYKNFLGTSPFAARTVRRWQLFLSLFALLPVAVCVYLLTVDSSQARPFAVFGTAYGVGYFVYLITYFPTRYRKRWLKRIRELGSDHPIDNRFGRASCTIVDDWLKSTSPLGESTYPLAVVREPVAAENHVFIYVDGQNALVIPKNKIADGNLEAFMQVLRGRIAE